MWTTPFPTACAQTCSTSPDSGVRSLVVDLTAVTFLDSTALGVLVGVYRRLADRGGGPAVVRASETQRRIFHITPLDTIIPIFPSLADATT